MISRLIVRAVFVALVAAAPLCARERNGWPLWVEQEAPDGSFRSGEYLGPLFFSRINPDGSASNGFRPLFFHATAGELETNLLFYPLFRWQRDGARRDFSFFELVNFRQETDADRRTSRNFDVWPFYFSRNTGDPEESYRALFPLGGTIKHRFGKDRINFTLFPLYAAVAKSGMHTTHVAWPFLRFVDGGGHHGFEFWPLFGHRARDGDYDSRFYLWPLVYRSARRLSDPQPSVSEGFLPFYTRDTGPGLVSETYAWPFFGYTRRAEPYHYDEQRYFWPFLVQAQGDQRTVNRWAPLYTHSVIKGYDKTWVAWPLFRHATWTDAGIAQEKNQFLYFLYWSQTQRSLTNPAAAPAGKTHLWPLLSAWDNGAGRRQLQLLSPFEVFFPTNEPVRQLYSPLFALYRYDRSDADTVRQSALFNLVSWKTSPQENEFHLGPLLHTRVTSGQTRVSLGLGLFNWSRPAAGTRWRFTLLDFSRMKANQAVAAKSP